MTLKKSIYSVMSIPFLLATPYLFANPINNVDITLEQITKDVTYLASDTLKGRANYSTDLEKAANYIAERFKSNGLIPLTAKSASDHNSFLQSYSIKQYVVNDINININNIDVDKANVAMVSTSPTTKWRFDKSTSERPNVKFHTIAKEDDFRQVIRKINATGGHHFVAVSTVHKDIFTRYQAYFSRGITKLSIDQKGDNVQGGTIVMLVTDQEIDQNTLSVSATTNIEQKQLNNVVGVLPGSTHAEEVVLYSAHYDHLGVKSDSKDSDIIYNGADDDASGTSAVINLAEYFAKKGQNKRTLMFVAFSAEEIGGFGSQYFSKQLNPDTITAMINIEMIGKPSKFGSGSLWMTGIERSTLGELMNKELQPYNMKVHADPYPKQGLFYRSDNATLARQGVPAHSFSSTQLDKDQHYHNVSDNIASLDLKSMHKVIQSLAIATQPLVDAKITPSRIDKNTIKNKGKIY